MAYTYPNGYIQVTCSVCGVELLWGYEAEHEDYFAAAYEYVENELVIGDHEHAAPVLAVDLPAIDTTCSRCGLDVKNNYTNGVGYTNNHNCAYGLNFF